MRQFFPFFICILFNSCQYFEKQVPSEKELLQKELKSINWKEVDEYPSVPSCEKIADEKLRQQCFFEVMSNLIQEKLNVDKSDSMINDNLKIFMDWILKLVNISNYK